MMSNFWFNLVAWLQLQVPLRTPTIQTIGLILTNIAKRLV
jgi:hypothetical protein